MISIFKKLGKNAVGFASGFNWYKYGAIAVVLAALMGGSYYKGKKDCEVNTAEKETAAAVERTRTIVRNVERRIPVVQTREVESARQKQEIKTLKEKLDDALIARPESPSCDLSDAEFRSVQDLAAKTRR